MTVFQVFSPLKIVPRNATIFIGSQLQLMIQGGPLPDANIEYVTLNEKIIEVVSNGLIKGVAIGTSSITARSVGVCPSTGEKIIHSQDTIDLHVIPLNGIKIVSPLTRFMLGTTVPAWITGLPEQLSPLLLGSMQPPINLVWSDHCEDIIEINGIFRDVGIRYSLSEEVTVRLKGMKTGRCTLEVAAVVPGAIAGRPALKDVRYMASIDLEVFEELMLSEPKFHCTKSLLLAPYSSLQLKTNMDGQGVLSYSLQDEFSSEDKSVTIPNNIVTISETGILQSYGSIGRTMIVITSMDDQGLKQAVTFVVLVKPVHYIMSNIESDWMISDSVINYVPVGAELRIVMSYHDNIGMEFNAAQLDLKYRSNRYDLVELKKNSAGFISYIIKPGSTMVKIWADSTQKTVDYINIVTGKVFKPNIKTLVTGDIFCLRSPVVDKFWKLGKWYSDDVDVVKVDAETGIGQALSSSAAQAAVSYSLTPAVKNHFNIEPIQQIVLKYEKKIISNTAEPIRVKMLLLGSDMKKKSNFVLGWDCGNDVERIVDFFPFRCDLYSTNTKIDVKEIFTAQPGFNKAHGLFSCNIFRTAPITPTTSIVDSNITLIVVAINGVESEPLSLVFKPAFYIPHNEISLSDTNYQTTLSITGTHEVLDQIEVVPMDKNLLSIDTPVQVGPNTINYDIHLIDYHWKFQELQYPLSVNVLSKLTNQNVLVTLKTHLGQDFNTKSLCYGQQFGSPTGNFFFQYRHVVTILLAVLILFFVTVYSYAHYIQPTINVNVEPQRALLQPQPSVHRFSPTGKRIYY